MKIEVTKQFYLIDANNKNKEKDIKNLFGKIGVVERNRKDGLLCDFGKDLKALIPHDAYKEVHDI